MIKKIFVLVLWVYFCSFLGRMYSGAHSVGTGKFEEASFPILCEECLGPDEHLRMMKTPFDNACKVKRF